MTLYPIELIRELLAPPMQMKPLSQSLPSRTFGKFARELPGTFPDKNTRRFRTTLQKSPTISGGQ